MSHQKNVILAQVYMYFNSKTILKNGKESREKKNCQTIWKKNNKKIFMCFSSFFLCCNEVQKVLKFETTIHKTKKFFFYYFLIHTNFSQTLYFTSLFECGLEDQSCFSILKAI